MSEGICKVYGWGVFDNSFLYVIMEMCEEGSLTDAIEKGIDPTEREEWLQQLAHGLLHMAELYVIHRDIKGDK